MAEGEATRDDTSSMEITRAKDGSYTWKLKRYYDGSSPSEWRHAFDDLAAIDGALRDKYITTGKNDVDLD